MAQEGRLLLPLTYHPNALQLNFCLDWFASTGTQSAGDTAKAPLPRAATAVRQPGPGAATSAALGEQIMTGAALSAVSVLAGL